MVDTALIARIDQLKTNLEWNFGLPYMPHLPGWNRQLYTEIPQVTEYIKSLEGNNEHRANLGAKKARAKPS